MKDKLKIRKVKKVGGSLIVVIPKNVGLEDGDYVSIDQVANSSTVLLTKVVRDDH
jgi:antitoxin component of MazEF toxin-antitoxin module